MKATDVELLIESAYSRLEPPPALEAAVRAALPAERARPVRRGRIALAALVVLAAVAAALARPRGGDGLADGGEDPELAVVARPPAGVVPEGGDWIRVRLTRDGRILVPQGDEWRQASLSEVGEHLERAATSFDERETAAGRSGYDRSPTGVAVSRLRVDLFVDRDAKWVHLQWIMTVCAERRMPRLALVVGGAGGPFRLDAALPVDAGLAEVPHVKVGVLVKAGEPTRYAFGGGESEELASVARYLAAAKKAAEATGAPVRGEVKAPARAPFREVAKLLAEFRQAGYEHVDFYGAPVPGDDVRNAAELPQPTSDWPVKETDPAKPAEPPAEAPPADGR